MLQPSITDQYPFLMGKNNRFSAADIERLRKKGMVVEEKPVEAPTRKDVPAKGDIPARGRGMNETEKAYNAYLEGLRLSGDIINFWYQKMVFHLTGDRCTITPDFVVQYPDGIVEIHDTKGGHMWEDAHIKMKVLREQFPFPVFTVRKIDGSWVKKEYKRK